MSNFEDNVRKWVNVDDELRRVNERARELREKRNTIASGIHHYVNNNQLGNATVNISDGRLRFVETTTAQSLTFKFLEECLSEIIPNNDSVKQIMTHIKSKRQSKSIPEIKRYFSE
jgi:hypothetical protein